MKIYLIAGEASGDRLGAALMAGLRQIRSDLQFHGVAGPLMQAEGMTSLFPMEELSIMGLAEILPKYFDLKRRIRETASDVVHVAPDVLITIDSPDFCLRVAKLVKAKCPIRTVHYVAPSVWAWRPGRAAKMARVIDHVLALLPFEPPYMERAGMACDFVGHPVTTEPLATPAERAAFRASLGLPSAHDPAAPLILALPGSRRGEVTRLAPIFGAALRPVLAQKPAAQVVIPTTRNVTDLVQNLTQDWPVTPLILDPRQSELAAYLAQKRASFAAADVALAASGTVSLELAANATPMVIAYDMAWLSRQIIPRMLKIDTVTLVNLVAESRTVPEFIGPACKPAPIGQALLDTLAHPEGQEAAMASTMARLGRGGLAPGLRAAQAVLSRLDA
ncbi:MAG TPA: lipid-A-disaccharide synthase [Rhodobacteraceae bacterium]|jgi:lipid-A-disaccharide synthase|nr:lipid-A-disaccharide synthase [Paracoccaceae bacterium]HBV54008.1 lipid-A-disaccharide synthase [Paracoccaceae bacterium]